MTTPGTGTDQQAIAADAYVFGYPLVLMDLTRAVQTNTVQANQATAPVNQFANRSSLPDPADTSVVRLNLDTLYSFAWLDLAAEPVVLQVPEMGDRYWLMQMMDTWTNTEQHPGATHQEPGAVGPFTYAITGPSWSGVLPDGAVALPMPTDSVMIAGRIELNGPEDVTNVNELQAQLVLMPLSAFLSGDYSPPDGVFDDSIDMLTPPPEQVAAMAPADFYNRLCDLLTVNPTPAADDEAMARFAKVGIVPGGNVDDLDPAMLARAAADAQQRISGHIDPGAVTHNGWSFSLNVGTYGTDYIQRAYIALFGLGANLPQDAIYPTVYGDMTDGGAYQLTFTPGQLPPAGAFWSITAYNADSFLIPNLAQIYAVGHQTPVAQRPDGSVVIALQFAKPGADFPSDSNWLPLMAEGPFNLTLRLYSPESAALDGTWKPPALIPTPAA